MRTPRMKLVAITAAGLLALTACGSSGGSDSGDGPIVIGLDCDTTGPGASYATPACDATKLAIEKVNSEGGVLGRDLKYVEANDESDPTKTPTVIQKLISKKAKALILITSSAGALQAKSLIERTGVPVIMPVAANPLLTSEPNNTYLYSLAATTADWAKSLCGGLEKMGVEKLGFLQDSSPSQAQFNKGFIEALDCVDVELESAPIDATDLSAEVARIKSKKPDAVMVGTQEINFEILAQNTLHQQMPDVPRFTEATLGAVPSAWKQANPGALDGLIGFAGLTDENKQTKEVGAFFAGKQGDDFALTQFWTQAYDGVQLLVNAIEKAGSTDGKEINDALQEIDGYEASFGYPGFTLSFSKDKHLGADGLCGEVLVEWNAQNQIAGPWSEYRPDCDAG